MLAISKHIVNWYLPNPTTEFRIIVVTGPPGVGKSCYANRAVGEAIGYVKTGKDICLWDEVKTHLGYHPFKVIRRFQAMKIDERDVAFHWDDAGEWLSSHKHHDVWVQSVGEYLQTARSDWGAILFSCLDREDIFSKVRNLKYAVVVDIIDNSDKKNPWRRHAYAWMPWKDRLGYKKGTNDLWDESFSCRMPPNFFVWYHSIRNQYSKIGKNLMEKRFKEKHKYLLKLADDAPL